MVCMNNNTTGYKSLDKLGNDSRVKEIYRDSDGIWLYTRAGFCVDPECHTAHGQNVREVTLHCVRLLRREAVSHSTRRQRERPAQDDNAHQTMHVC